MHSSKIIKYDVLNLRSVERPPKLGELIEAQLVDAISKQVFREDEALPSENGLAKLFGVSRNVIREALLMLNTKGLIEIRKGRRAFVTKPSIDNVLDPFSRLVNYKCGNEGLIHILAVRQMIEPTVAALAAKHRTVESLNKLEGSLRMMQLYQQDEIKISQHDIHFHNIISWSCDNPLIPIVLEPIFHVLSRFHPPIFHDPNVIGITLEYHDKIFQAIQKQDSQAAFQAMAEHLKKTESHNLRFYHKTEQPTVKI